MPKVSVIVPVYNVEKYLDCCLQSILNQTLQDIEVILVDDGSPDNCPVMCDEYAKNDSRVKVVHKKNGGLGYARNSGLDVATGEYIAFCDSDDFVEPSMYEDLYRKAKQENADVVFSNFIYFRGGAKTIRHSVDKEVVVKGRQNVDDFLLDFVAPLPNENRDVKYHPSACLLLYRKSVIDTYGLRLLSERQVVSEDMVFNIEFLKKAECVVHVKEAYYNYRANEASLTHNVSIEKNDKYLVLMKSVEEMLEDVNIDNSIKELHFLRFVLLYLRYCLRSEYSYCRAKDVDWYSQLSYRLQQMPYKKALSLYPINKMPLKFRVFWSVVKLRNPFLISLMLRFL